MTLERIITSKARRKVLEFFLNGPKEEAGIREVSRKTGVGVHSADIETKNLLSAGILGLREGRYPRRFFLRESRFAKVLSELFSLDLPDFARLENALATERDVDSAFVYGSLAEGKANARSDIDLLVVITGNAPPKRLLQAFGEFERMFGREVNYSFVSKKVLLENEGTDPFLKRVLLGKKILLKKSGISEKWEQH